MGKSIWQRADELARTASSIGQGQPDARVAAMVADLAVLVRDFAERAGMRNEGIDHPLLHGTTYELTVKVRASITDIQVDRDDDKDPERVTGLAYEIEAEHRNFLGGRVFAVDADEIVDARILP